MVPSRIEDERGIRLDSLAVVIALSSFRPNATGEYADNQHRARATWLKVFDAILYFNSPQVDMMGPNIAFKESSNPPTIKRMMECASRAPNWCCIVNADIVLAAKFLKVEAKLKEMGAKCAISRRFNFDPNKIGEPSKSDDLGLDIFCAVPQVWAHAATNVPEQYVISRQRWDNWTVAFFMAHYPEDCVDFSESGVIFHPRHDGRLDQSMDEHDAALVAGMRWPHKRLKV